MNLTSAQRRALVQFAESMLITAVIAGLFAIAPLIESTGPLDWGKVGLFFLFAVLFSVGHSVAAYFKSNNQVDLGAVLEGMVNAVEKRTQQPVQGIAPGDPTTIPAAPHSPPAAPVVSAQETANETTAQRAAVQPHG